MASLIIYGTPPFTDTFTSGITPTNRRSFERLLVPELEKLGNFDLKPATVRRICHVHELTDLLKGRFERVVFYGHGYTLNRGGRSELILSTACNTSISAQQFADALRGSPVVSDVLIAGCNSNAFAADLATRFPKIRFGGIQATRFDTIGGTKTAITEFRIETKAIKWWGGK